MLKSLTLAAGMTLCGAGLAHATTVLADFDTISPSVPGMSIAAPGTGACALFTGGVGNALCGTNTDTVDNSVGATLSFALDFDRIESLSFDLAAQSANDRFDQANGSSGDFVRVFGNTALSGNVLLAEFTLSPTTNTNMASTANGALLGTGTEVDASFDTITLSGFDTVVDGVGTLEFQLKSTAPGGTRGSDPFEDIGIDQIRVETIPLPAPALLLIGGVAALTLVRRRAKA